MKTDKTIALVGNPNSGKTTLFNSLTGSSQRVGNWPGVTVDKKVGKLRGHGDTKVVDLPGIYSLSPYSPEEVIARDYLADDSPDAIINIVDATNLERNLFLTTQLLELDIPVVVALNMMDVARSKGYEIDEKKLSERLGCPVVPISALKKEGMDQVIGEAVAAVGSEKKLRMIFPERVETALSEISLAFDLSVPVRLHRWYSVKLVERDPDITEKMGAQMSRIDPILSKLEASMDSDGETIIIDGRYSFITDAVGESLKKSETEVVTLSDKIDKIVTNRILALPIFAGIMFIIYYLSITTIGGMGTDWVNEQFFEEWAIPGSREWLEGIGTADWLTSLIVDGIITGVGAVIGFLPQMLVMFLLLGILEDSGYMARVAFIMDRIFRRFGLSGKSFIPALISTGCAVPGIMASRTIEDERDRKITAMTTSFMPCSAKLPIIALIAGALFRESPWIAPSTYFIGIFAILFSGVILKKLKGFVGTPAPFIMELPAYHAPSAVTVGKGAFDRLMHFVKKAGTIIVLACGLIWFLSSYNWGMASVEVGESMLADIGNAIANIFAPLGWSDWRAAVGTITGLVAKENVVSTFGILFGFEEVAEGGDEIWALLPQLFPTWIAGFSFLLFNLLCAPCFAAIGAMRRELGGWKETAFAVGYQCGFAYAVAMVFYQVGTALTGGGVTIFLPIALVVLGIMIWLFVRPMPDDRSEAVEEAVTA